MFRELTRKKQKLPFDDCIKILEEQTRGVLSVSGDNGYPYGMPLNHFYNAEDSSLYFHTGKTGHRTDSLLNNAKASFCVYDSGTRENGEWAYTVNSVIVFGKIEIIDDIDKVINITEKLCKKFTDDENYIKNEIKNFANKTILLKLIPEHICGKKVKEA